MWGITGLSENVLASEVGLCYTKFVSTFVFTYNSWKTSGSELSGSKQFCVGTSLDTVVTGIEIR